MRITSFHLLVTALLLSASPAPAQFVGKPVYGPVAKPNPFGSDSRLPAPPPRREARQISEQIDRDREAGRLTAKEARQLKREARQIGRLARRYGRDGLSSSEIRELEARNLYLRSSVNSVLPPRSRNTRN